MDARGDACADMCQARATAPLVSSRRGRLTVASQICSHARDIAAAMPIQSRHSAGIEPI